MAPVFLEAERIWLARLRLRRGLAGAALDLLKPLHYQARAAGRFGRVIEICLLQALAWHALGDTAAALKTFRESLALAAPEGYVRVYLDEGGTLLPLLSGLEREPLASRPLLDHAHVLAQALALARDLESAAIDASSRPIEALTARERQVLRLIASGLTSVQIADALVIAVSTARTHIKNIYGKLAVHSRYEAVERARQLRLL